MRYLSAKSAEMTKSGHDSCFLSLSHSFGVSKNATRKKSSRSNSKDGNDRTRICVTPLILIFSIKSAPGLLLNWLVAEIAEDIPEWLREQVSSSCSRGIANAKPYICSRGARAASALQSCVTPEPRRWEGEGMQWRTKNTRNNFFLASSWYIIKIRFYWIRRLLKQKL